MCVRSFHFRQTMFAAVTGSRTGMPIEGEPKVRTARPLREPEQVGGLRTALNFAPDHSRVTSLGCGEHQDAGNDATAAERLQRA